MKNLKLKLFSLAIAAMLAYFVSSKNNSTVISLFVPVEIGGLPTSKVIVWPLNRQAQVTIKGPSFLVSRIPFSPPVFRVRMPDDVENSYVAILNQSDLNLGPSVEVLNIEPREIEFTLDDLVTKNVQVEVPRLGELPEGLKIADFRLNPATISLVGPETELRNITRVETDPIDLRSIDGDVERALRIRKRPGTLSALSAEEVVVTVTVSVLQVYRKFDSLPVEVRAASGASYTVDPEHVRVELTGPKDLISKMNAAEVVPYVRPEDGDGGVAKVLIELPSGMAVVFINPEKVSVSRVK